MFGLFNKKEKKDPICGMIANEKFISKYGEKFCSDDCVRKYEEKEKIANVKNSGGGCGGCC